MFWSEKLTRKICKHIFIRLFHGKKVIELECESQGTEQHA
jgi:hypothetical protein